MTRLIALIGAILISVPAMAADLSERPGWAVHPTEMSYKDLIGKMKPAIKSQKMGLVTQAGPTGAAKSRGITIPGNRVFGVFNNKFAVRTINLSVNAMIEAPIRMYVTENADGTATLSYKTPTHVLSAYFDEGGDELKKVASELDAIFAAIAADATKP